MTVEMTNPVDVTNPNPDRGVPPCLHTAFTDGCRYCEWWGGLSPVLRRGHEAQLRQRYPALYDPPTQEQVAAVRTKYEQSFRSVEEHLPPESIMPRAPGSHHLPPVEMARDLARVFGQDPDAVRERIESFLRTEHPKGSYEEHLQQNALHKIQHEQRMRAAALPTQPVAAPDVVDAQHGSVAQADAWARQHYNYGQGFFPVQGQQRKQGGGSSWRGKAEGAGPKSGPKQGPGTELKAVFAARGVPACSSCIKEAEDMDKNGVAWCREHFDEIVERLKERATKMGWWTWIKAGVGTAKRAVTAGEPVTIEGLVELAIQRAAKAGDSSSPS